MQKTDTDWIDALPDDDVQVGMLKFLESNKPGAISVGDLVKISNVGKSHAADTLKKMVGYNQISVDYDGRVFLTGFGRRMASKK